ncbi:SusC/RagA family TonB-linked outer membrane protein [Aquimarina algicola]|uniref:TonB-dependent receptor n=1 Tax=Aquimarina algicola TaxID=2589995 RepID=A0A504J0R6_9FLAO|nr:TonB-dependent receptor [Aquimarina algicola]TPN84004.1 TonB-dependent receptor [Aquimarina algicola]
MNQKTYITFLVFFLGIITIASAQLSVSGTVTESQGPLPGVNILVKGTQNGTTTDFDGKYSISNVPEDAILTFSYLGFVTKEVSVNGQSVIDVVLQEDAAALDEIVVVGYGTQSKREVTGAISQIKSDDIAQIVTANPTAALQGKLAGVQVETAGGAPGSPANVFVRGISSLTNSFPLYVIDGTIVDDIVFLNPKDIIDIQVLKDATSAAIYGSRAANGVIIVTTNRGKKDTSPTVNIDVRGGINTQPKKLDLLNGPEYIQFLNQRRINDGLPGNIADPGIDTDFQDLTINSGSIQDYGFNISGGNEQSSYFFSSNYYKEEGLLISEDFQRINTRLNSQFEIGKFKIKESFSFAENTFTQNLAFGNQGPTLPILNPFNPNNEGGFEAVDGDRYPGVGGTNKFAQANLLDDENTERNLLGNINISYEILEGLTAKLNLGVDYKNIYRNTFLPTFFQSNTDATNNLNEANDLTEVRAEILSTNVEPTLNYKKVFNNHSIDVLVGGARQEVDNNTLAVYAQGLPSNDIRNIGNFTELVENTGGGRFESRLFSYYARLNYKFNDRYLFSGIIRRDATSRFSSKDDLNADVFPSFSLGWVVSEENFWPEDSFINTLKLRGGYGELGSQNIGDFVFQSVLNPSSNVAFADNPAQGFAITSLVNENISFETSITTNFGADISMFDNSLKVSLDYFNRDNEDVLLALAVPSTSGSANPIIQNAASINNKGFELEATYSYNTESDFKFDVGVNFAAIDNELTSAANPILGPVINEEQTRVNRYEEGNPLGFFFGFQTDGIYTSQEQIDNDPFLANDPERRGILQPGDFRRVDTNGDGRVDETDRVNLGDPTPDFTYGINFTGSYKKLDFGLFFNGVQGNEIYNVTKFFGVFFADDNKFGLVRDAFTPQNTNTNIPRVTNLDPAGNQLPSDFFVEDGSFFRLKTLEIGYDLTDIIGSEWVKKGRVFFNMQNVFVITNYSGYDPEVGSTSGAQADADTGFFGFRGVTNPIFGRGLDVRAQPRPRTFIMGLQFSF